MDIEKTQNCIEANRHNNETTTYYLAFKKFIKEGGKSSCDMSSNQFNKMLLEPTTSNNRRDGLKNMVLMENFFTANHSTQGNLRKKSKQKIREKVDKSQKENKEPNEKQKDNLFVTESKYNYNSESSVLPGKRSRKDSKVTKIDPRI